MRVIFGYTFGMVFHGRDRYVYQSSGPNDDRIDVVLNTDSEDLIQLVSKVRI